MIQTIFRSQLLSPSLSFSRCSPVFLGRRRNSRQFASTLQTLSVPTTSNKTICVESELIRPRNSRPQSKAQEYLDYIASTNTDISLEDIERYKPRTHSASDSSHYESEYNALLDQLVRSFSVKQLQKVLELYKLRPPAKRTKWNYAVSIIERQWKWPSLKSVQKDRRDWTEVSYETFLLDPSHSFLLLGKDGADLLTLSSQYNVHLSLSTNPLSLKVEGLRGSLDLLSQHIKHLTENITVEIFELPMNQEISSHMVQRISRLSGAFLENYADKKLRLSYRTGDSNAANMAKRLVMGVICEDNLTSSFVSYVPQTSDLIYSGSFSSYALYPFAVANSLPWATSNEGLFRIKYIVDWLNPTLTEDIELTGGLAGERGIISTLDERRMNIRDILISRLPDKSHQSDTTRSILAYPGHLLLRSPAKQKSHLTPPLTGPLQLPTIKKWMKDHGVNHIFSSSLPQPLLTSRPKEQHFLYRLEYVGLDASNQSKDSTLAYDSILNFEMSLGMKSGAVQRPTNVPADDIFSASSSQPGLDAKTAGKALSLRFICSTKRIATLDLAMPDRPMDMRLSAVERNLVPTEQWPEELKTYHHLFEPSQEFPEHMQAAPPIVTHGGVTYGLRHLCSVRQNLIGYETGALNFIDEILTDRGSNQILSNFVIPCDDFNSDTSWKSFMGKCDWITTGASKLHGLPNKTLYDRSTDEDNQISR